MFFITLKTYLCLFSLFLFSFGKNQNFLDICDQRNSRKLYVEFESSGVLLADYKNRLFVNNKYSGNVIQKKCNIEFITCPSCIIEMKFKYLNISRTCGRSSVFSTCGCDYVLLHELPFEDASGEQFCGRFIHNNVSELNYISSTRSIAVNFVFTQEYGHAFTLEFTSKRNRIVFDNYPKAGKTNNHSQIITSPFFPNLYPSDLSVEYVVACHSEEPCRISLIFTDFLMADSSILEFFDWNGQRMYVISGNMFRPPVIVTSGPTLVVRFYANGASDFGFKASYSFILENLDDLTFKPDIGCGGQVNNLGGGITMMNMLSEGTKFFDCVWIVKPPTNFLHRKTHMYVKVVNFTNFAGTTELTLRQGLTSNEPTIEVLRYPLSPFNSAREKEHVVPISQGFYISLRGLFNTESQVAVVYAAFNYKDCFSGLDFPCLNLRCISTLLNCDGFDHCGDNSDESADCSEDPKDRRQFSKIPNFLFPKVEQYADLTTATFVFLVCSFGLIGIIFAMALLLYRLNIKAKHQREMHDHIETIHAMLEEGVGGIEEEIIIPDDPPDYEPPPEYTDVLKYIKKVASGNRQRQKNLSALKPSSQSTPTCSTSSSTSLKSVTIDNNETSSSVASTSKGCQTTTVKVPQSPPPSYENIELIDKEYKEPNVKKNFHFDGYFNQTPCGSRDCMHRVQGSSVDIGVIINRQSAYLSDSLEEVSCFPKKALVDITASLRENLRKYKSTVFLKNTKKTFSFSEENLVKYFSDSELLFNSTVNINGQFKCNKTKRSFSNDDIFSL